MTAPVGKKPVLTVKELVIEFQTERGVVRAVDGVSFELYAGQTLGIVGESGCGKTVTCLALLGLVPTPPGRIVSGSIELNGRNIVGLGDREMRNIRGRDISMIFQEPMTALNPVFTVGNQLCEVIRRHTDATRRQAHAQAVEMLAVVGIPAPAKRMGDYPHQLSGGMRQRVMIAMALSCNPSVLVADEPTTALDVTTQAQVIEQMVLLQEQFDMAVILITHDLGVVAETCEDVMVMYCGQVIEQAPASGLFTRPSHPYTAGLLASIPRIRRERLQELPVIRGMVPDLLSLPMGCRFSTRCEYADQRCQAQIPSLRTATGTDAAVACFKPLGEA
ncbi:MAG: ABC transporter ATP-binding protein [Gammaproteobacteria bacterium]|nr:ABC transporter ATP-binding protein [Gammaproteobacteria bacterium]